MYVSYFGLYRLKLQNVEGTSKHPVVFATSRPLAFRNQLRPCQGGPWRTVVKHFVWETGLVVVTTTLILYKCYDQNSSQCVPLLSEASLQVAKKATVQRLQRLHCNIFGTASWEQYFVSLAAFELKTGWALTLSTCLSLMLKALASLLEVSALFLVFYYVLQHLNDAILEEGPTHLVKQHFLFLPPLLITRGIIHNHRLR